MTIRPFAAEQNSAYPPTRAPGNAVRDAGGFVQEATRLRNGQSMNSAVLALGATLMSVLADSSQPRAGRAPTRYRIDIITESLIDLSSFGGAPVNVTQKITAWIGFTLTDTTGGRVLHATIDSATAESDPPAITQQSADSARGASIHGFVGANRQVQQLKPSENAGTVATVLSGLMGVLLPRGLGAGAKVDTSDVGTDAPDQKVDTRFIRTYTPTGRETVGGIAGTRYDVTFTSSMSGTATIPIGPVQFEGEGSGTGSEVLAANGTHLGGTISSTTSQKLTIGGAQTIPVGLRQTLTVTYLP